LGNCVLFIQGCIAYDARRGCKICHCALQFTAQHLELLRTVVKVKDAIDNQERSTG